MLRRGARRDASALYSARNIAVTAATTTTVRGDRRAASRRSSSSRSGGGTSFLSFARESGSGACPGSCSGGLADTVCFACRTLFVVFILSVFICSRCCCLYFCSCCCGSTVVNPCVRFTSSQHDIYSDRSIHRQLSLVCSTLFLNAR